jgi:hypothetical protein
MKGVIEIWQKREGGKFSLQTSHHNKQQTVDPFHHAFAVPYSTNTHRRLR